MRPGKSRLHGLKRLNHSGFCAGWAGLILVLMVGFMVVPPILKKAINVRLPEARNCYEQPLEGEMPTVYIRRDGTVNLDDQCVDDLEKLTTMIEERMEELKQDNMSKVLVKADRDCRFEQMTVVLRKLSRAKVKVAGLITWDYQDHRFLFTDYEMEELGLKGRRSFLYF